MAWASRWRAFARWFRPHAKMCLGLGLGIAVGIGCRFPAGWALPDNTSAMFAAVIGALATAAAVVLGVAAQHESEVEKDGLRQANLRQRLQISLMPLVSQARRTYTAGSDVSDRLLRATSLVEDASAALSRIRDSRLFNEELDNDGLVAMTFLEIRLATLLTIAQTLKSYAATAQLGGEEEGDNQWQGCRKDLRKLVNEVIDELDKLTANDSSVWKIPES